MKKTEVKRGNKRTKLTEKEQLYFDIIKSGNVLFLKGAPGTAKSAIPNTISKLMNFQYISLHLAQSDNVDLGQYPVPKTKDDYTIIDYAVPGWAVKANQAPTIIHFEELNRCRQDIQDAALQLLNEREIGTNFKFNENVYMVSSGNLGEEDGTEIKDLDNAMNNRLVHKLHILTLDEWIEGFANENVSKYIISFLKAHPEHYIKVPVEGEVAYPSPRSWTNLDRFFSSMAKGKEPTLQEVEIQAIRCGEGFIGPSIAKFIKYINDMKELNFVDILDHLDEIDLSTLTRPKISEILQQAREFEVEDMKNKQIKNIMKFIQTVIDKDNEDQFVNYALFVIENLNIVDLGEFEEKPQTIKLAKWFKKNLNLLKLVKSK